MLPKRFANLLFSFFLSGIMSLLVSGITTFRTAPTGANLFGDWLGSWLSSWLVAFPAVLVVAPLARRIAGRLTQTEK